MTTCNIAAKAGPEVDDQRLFDILREGRPTVIDVLIDKDAVPPIHARIKTVEELS